MKKKYLSIIGGILVMVIWFLLQNHSYAASQELSSLDFQAQLNDDGSMNVTETWDVTIRDTNTLFKTFEVDSQKYTGISDIYVQEVLSDGSVKNFQKINQEMYHVTKDCYYGLRNSNGQFEIAWGVSVDNKETRKFKINYKVIGAVKNYQDCSELYWQFVGKDFKINANKVTGTITLPKAVEKKEDIRAWLHAQLNGEVRIPSTNMVTFEINNFQANQYYIEARMTTPTTIFSNNVNQIATNRFDTIIEEETQWANQSNAIRKQNETTRNTAIAVIAIVGIAFSILLITKWIKYRRILKQTPKLVPSQILDYFREIPNEQATPAEVGFLYYLSSAGIESRIANIMSATMLDLCLKQYIHFDVEEKNSIKVTLLKNTTEGLKENEAVIHELLLKVKKGEPFTMKQFQSYLTNHATSFEQIKLRIKESAEQEEINFANYDKEERKQYNNWIGKMVLYIILAIIGLAFPIVTILGIVNAVYSYQIGKRHIGYTQKGIDELEQWKGLKKYMEDFSLLKEREVPELVLWEKYLIYATVFGISEKVLKQLKVVYPDLQNSEYLNNTAYFYLMYHANLSTSFVNSLNSSITSAYTSTTYSSGGGFGGGASFGGGGGGGRRWWPEADSFLNNKRRIQFWIHFKLYSSF